MTKSFKLGCVYLAALVSLTLARLIFGFVNLSDNLSNWLFSVVMQCGFMGLMPYLMIKFISPKDAGFRDSVYLKASHLKPVTYLYAVAIGLLGFVLNVGVSSLSYTFWEATGYVSVSSSGTVYSGIEVLILEVITGSMMPAVFEEITHRGVLQGALEEQGVPDGAKVFVMALFFGLGHQNILQLIPTFVIGLIISYMAVKCRSIVPGMIVHFMNNFIITFFDYAEQVGLGIAYAYNVFVNFMFSSLFVLFGAMAAATVCIILLLREITRENARAAKKANGAPPVPSDVPGGVYDVGDVFNGYGGIGGRAGGYYGYFAERNAAPAAKSSEKRFKADVAAIALLTIGAIAAAAGTVFTLIWGILR